MRKAGYCFQINFNDKKSLSGYYVFYTLRCLQFFLSFDGVNRSKSISREQ